MEMAKATTGGRACTSSRLQRFRSRAPGCFTLAQQQQEHSRNASKEERFGRCAPLLPFQNLFLCALTHRLTYLHVLLPACREVMLRGEVAAPFRKARKYLWLAAGGSASIGTGTALLQLFAKLAGAPRPPPVNTSLQNISINAIALTILCMLPHKRRNPMTCSAGS